MLNKNKYEFSNEENFNDVYSITKIQFKKIINNFNESRFEDNFTEIFYGDQDYHKLFLSKNDSILCGTLAFKFEEYAFTDIFFWNEINHKRNTKEFRFFCERFFLDTQKIGINNTIMPLDESRFKHEAFKKYCQKIFFSNTEYKISDPLINEEYKNHYLLKVNHKNYFKKAEEAKVRILHE